MADAVHTFTGVWHNWSHGAIRGATLTLNQKDAGYLTAFLAIFVSFAGGMFWRITSFVLHQVWATNPDQGHDILHHRRQVILRNSGAGAASWSLLMLGFGRHGSILRSLPVAIIPAGILLLFGVSGIFTSYVTKFPGNATIITGPHCGNVLMSNLTPSTLGLRIMSAKNMADSHDAATYVTQCYQGASSVGCGQYVRNSLPFNRNQNASCPFASGICAYNDNSALELDTGLLDSHLDFGINERPRDRIKFRRVATCAPIHGKPFAVTVDNSSLGTIDYIYAGPVPSTGTNYSFQYIINSAFDGFGYTLSSLVAPAGLPEYYDADYWKPDPRLNQTDADITLMMLAANSIWYNTPVDDPWLSAHVKETMDDLTLYTSDYYVTLLGCTDQYQVCNPNIDGDSGCTVLGGAMSCWNDVVDRNGIGFNLIQLNTITRFLATASHRNIQSVVDGRGASALQVSQLAYNNIIYNLPVNQWQLEVEGWFNNSLAKEQAWAVEWATTPRNYQPNPPGDPVWLYDPPNNLVGLALCGSQLVRNMGDYESFSILGLSLIIGLGGIIILVGFTIDSIVGWLQSPKARYKADQWHLEENIQLHKAAYKGFGIWREDGLDLPPSTALQHAVPNYGDHVRESLEKNANAATSLLSNRLLR